MSCATRSTFWLVSAAIISCRRAFMRMISRACTSISDAVPWKPAEAWWIRMRELGRADRFALGTTPQQHGPHAGGHANTRRSDLGLDKVHGVVDGEPRVDLAARAVDVHLDLAVRVVL